MKRHKWANKEHRQECVVCGAFRTCYANGQASAIYLTTGERQPYCEGKAGITQKDRFGVIARAQDEKTRAERHLGFHRAALGVWPECVAEIRDIWKAKGYRVRVMASWKPGRKDIYVKKAEVQHGESSQESVELPAFPDITDKVDAKVQAIEEAHRRAAKSTLRFRKVKVQK